MFGKAIKEYGSAVLIKFHMAEVIFASLSLNNMVKSKKRKFIFVVGGVMSGVGKGLRGIARCLLQSKGYKVTALKADRM